MGKKTSLCKECVLSESLASFESFYLCKVVMISYNIRVYAQYNLLNSTFTLTKDRQ